MKVRDIHALLDSWAPREIAWEKDNVGLQVGDPDATIRGILVSLDVTGAVLAEAKKKNANLIVSHHPLLFEPVQTITPSSDIGRIIQESIREGIHVYAAHTNLDFTRGGTSFALAEALGLSNVDFLVKSYQIQRKIVTFVPSGKVDLVADAMAQAGAGRIGNYENCSFRTAGTGTFMGTAGTHPSVGKPGKLENVDEVRLEMIANNWQLPEVIKAMKAAHPYEEVAFDIYRMENRSDDFGMGIIGELPERVRLHSFLKKVKKVLGTPMVRCTGELERNVKKIAACGGSGSDLVDEAIEEGADVFITADVRYHMFHHAMGRIALIDAGHYETEQPMVHSLVKVLKERVATMKERIPVFSANVSTNPVRYV